MALENGFLIVASETKQYVISANFCAGSIKDYYPDAHITLFVPDNLRQYADPSVFNIIESKDVPSHIRTKLYALGQTPYSNLTCYVDADMECKHEDVSRIWEQFQSKQSADILITQIRPYNGKITKWDGGELTHHCGFFVYRTNDRTINFMKKWWNDYVDQMQTWKYTYTIQLQPWDQFTFWKLLNVDKLDVIVDFLKDDARWNFVNGYRLHENKNPIIFYHHTLPQN